MRTITNDYRLISRSGHGTFYKTKFKLGRSSFASPVE